MGHTAASQSLDWRLEPERRSRRILKAKAGTEYGAGLRHIPGLEGISGPARPGSVEAVHERRPRWPREVRAGLEAIE